MAGEAGVAHFTEDLLDILKVSRGLITALHMVSDCLKALTTAVPLRGNDLRVREPLPNALGGHTIPMTGTSFLEAVPDDTSMITSDRVQMSRLSQWQM